jgi:hypothetical protein
VYRRTLIVALLLLAATLVVPAVAPIHVGYATTDDMAPTVEAGDAYVVVPSDGADPGDVVVYWTALRGKYVATRVVERTDAGLITRRDAANATDQARGYPPFRPENLGGELATVGGRPLTVPLAGHVVAALRTHGTLAASLGVAALAALVVGAWLRDRDARGTHDPVTVGDATRLLVLFLLVTSVLVPALGTTSYRVAELEPGGANASVEPGGTNASIETAGGGTVYLRPAPPPFVDVVVDAADATPTVNATGVYVRFDPPVGERRLTAYAYLGTVPRPWLVAAHEAHPLAAVAVTALVLVVPAALLGVVLGLDRPLSRARRR